MVIGLSGVQFGLLSLRVINKIGWAQSANPICLITSNDNRQLDEHESYYQFIIIITISENWSERQNFCR